MFLLCFAVDIWMQLVRSVSPISERSSKASAHPPSPCNEREFAIEGGQNRVGCVVKCVGVRCRGGDAGARTEKPRGVHAPDAPGPRVRRVGRVHTSRFFRPRAGVSASAPPDTFYYTAYARSTALSYARTLACLQGEGGSTLTDSICRGYLLTDLTAVVRNLDET